MICSDWQSAAANSSAGKEAYPAVRGEPEGDPRTLQRFLVTGQILWAGVATQSAPDEDVRYLTEDVFEHGVEECIHAYHRYLRLGAASRV